LQEEQKNGFAEDLTALARQNKLRNWMNQTCKEMRSPLISYERIEQKLYPALSK